MKRFLIILMAAALAGCAAKSLNPGAERVMLVNSAPSENCKFVGEVYGGQGNWWTDDITSTKALVEGSRNDIKNQAHAIGANYVHIQQAAQDTSYLGGGKIGMAGNAFNCSNSR
jgi:hypothetical protein